VTRWIKVLACVVVLLEVTASSAQAQPPPTTVTVDFYVTATSDLELAYTGLELVINPVGSPMSTPAFLSGADQPTAFLNDPSYVFYGQSFDYAILSPPAFWSDPGPSPGPNSYPAGEITGGDAAFPASYVTLVADQTYLLAEVSYNVYSPGDTFTLGVINEYSQTYFQDQNSNNYTITSFNSSTNTFTIAASVPEPSSLTMLAISSSLCGLLWYRSHRKASRTPK
jgi:hypothetical protein